MTDSSIDWQRMQSAFLAVVDLPAAEREAALEVLCAGDVMLRDEVESLLRADRDSAITIDSAIQGLAFTVMETPVVVGERLGVYRILREIGRGGMGSVYLAQRDDEEFTKEVALKVVKGGMNTEEVLRRFRAERQILANLDHPYIARLFDGGTTTAGVPFFAMEYVEGLPVDAFCRNNKLSVKERCALFLNILEAVSYAHRNLIVHGDLKPANIFVKIDGTPKLLDFGVAKLIGGEEPVSTTASGDGRAFTPGYASPEQVRGTVVTVLTDIYSLGAVLYEMLAGKRAQPLDFDTPTRIQHAVCEVDVHRPSLSNPDIPADLDAIVLMAVAKDPAQRYGSAEQFAEDIRRSLADRPVLALPGTFGYRARKFLSRNYLEVALAAVVVLALVTGLAVSLVQTSRARAERRTADAERSIALQAQTTANEQKTLAEEQRRRADQQRVIADQQRDEAQTEKGKADDRLHNLIELAGRTLFDEQATIATLPGSIEARRQLVQTTLDYLQSLEKDASTNKDMKQDMREAIAEAYYKLALIQGDPHGPSLQDAAGAKKSLDKANEVLLPSYRAAPDSAGLMLRWIEIHATMGELAAASGHKDDAAQMFIDLIPVAQRLAKARGCNIVCETQEPVMENFVAVELAPIDPRRSLVYANKGIAAARGVLARHPGNEEMEQGLGSLTAVAASANRNLGNLEESARDYEASIAAREAILRKDPNNLPIQRNMMVVCGNYAQLLGIPFSPNLNRPEQARLYATKSLDIARKMSTADPTNGNARRDLGAALGHLGMIDPAPGNAAAALATLKEAEGIVTPMLAASPTSFETAVQLGEILEFEGRRLRDAGDRQQAAAAFVRALAVFQPFVSQSGVGTNSDFIRIEEEFAALYASMGESARALDMAIKAQADAEGFAAGSHTPELQAVARAGAWATLAQVQAAASPARARESATKARQLWATIPNRGLLTAYRDLIEHNDTLLH